jgi:hypothetical protein
VPVKIGKKGKAFVYHMQSKGRDGEGKLTVLKGGCGYRGYFGRAVSDAMIDRYLETKNHDRNDKENPGKEIHAEAEAGDDGDDGGAAAGSAARDDDDGTPAHWR